MSAARFFARSGSWVSRGAACCAPVERGSREIEGRKTQHMSRIGRKPIPVPAGVKINTSGGKVEVQGPKGKLLVLVPRQIKLEQKDGVLTAVRSSEEDRALHGLARALLANAVQGVTTGFKKDMDIVG